MSRLSRLISIALAAAMTACHPHTAGLRPIGNQYPIYQSIGSGKQSLVLIENGTLHFGGASDTEGDLLASDIGYTLVFEKVVGGIRARTRPILFPDGSQTGFEFEDYSCSVTYRETLSAVSCVSRANGRVSKSLVDAGALVEFEDRCFYDLDQDCRYRLAGGPALKPTNVQPAS